MFLHRETRMSENMSSSENKTKKRISFWMRLAITAIILAYLIHKINFHELATQMLQANFSYILLAIIVAIFSYIVLAFRWRNVIKALSENTLPKKKCFHLVLIGLFFNQFMLASVGGDAVRIWLTTRNNITGRIAFNSVLFDRLFGLLMLTLLIGACLPLYETVLPNELTFISLSLLIIAVIVGMLVLLFVDQFPWLSRIAFFQKTIGKLSKDARTAFLSIKNARIPVLYACISVLLPPIMMYLIGQAYHLPISLSRCFVIVPPVILVSALPISIAGWGVREGGMVVVASYLGITASQAVVVSVWFGVVMILSSLPGAIFWLMRKETTKQIESEYEAAT